ncbi:uncharacterized protein LOC132067603 [Lycium ferocissimum]|uniref:uncharacterized protein LOC132067603 n=1 Tax=Lycium ferocissimum TaxID=112874 RepID=UPI0028149AA9|nr:uncharacterized protein LOC132067603 [Lycium ferocissimum]XP_059316862.1 uncharacterized protein LOC132067603 [Lycium ferocissimum]
MATLMYHMLSSSSLLSLGLYHLICTTRNRLKSTVGGDYTAKPYHPLSFTSQPHLRRLPLYILLVCLLISLIHQSLVSFDADPLLKGHTPVHKFTSLQSAAVVFAFLILVLFIVVSESSNVLPVPSDLFFAIAGALFWLQYSVSESSASVQTSDLQAKCDSVSARISAISALLCVVIAFQPRVFLADVALAGSICLQGLWVLQTGLSLYVDAFIPDGCHKLLDVVTGVEGSTKCDLEDSKLRAVAILDLAFVVHVMFVLLIVVVTYAAVAKTVGIRRFGSYEALPNTDSNIIQMKAMTGTQA